MDTIFKIVLVTLLAVGLYTLNTNQRVADKSLTKTTPQIKNKNYINNDINQKTKKNIVKRDLSKSINIKENFANSVKKTKTNIKNIHQLTKQQKIVKKEYENYQYRQKQFFLQKANLEKLYKLRALRAKKISEYRKKQQMLIAMKMKHYNQYKQKRLKLLEFRYKTMHMYSVQKNYKR